MNKFLTILGKFSTKIKNLEWILDIRHGMVKNIALCFTFQHFVFMSKLFSFVSKISFYVRNHKNSIQPFYIGKDN
jgi:hypothetical protein